MSDRSMLPLSLLAVLLLLALLAIAGVAGADLGAQETPLNPEGLAYEINIGPQGLLWISENNEKEIWALDPASGDYTVYQDAGDVSDARRAPDGTVWWIDQLRNRLGRLEPDSRDVTLWDLPVETVPFGTAIDGNGQVWVTEFFRPRVYRLAVESGQLCTYTLSTIGASDYILAYGSDLWLGDWINDAVHRLDGDSGVLTSWALPYNARPEGLALDGGGHVWWADSDRHHLARLEPTLDRLTTYPLPLGSTPRMLAASGHRIWYTEDTRRTLGRLDPFLAAGTSQAIPTEAIALAAVCSGISPVATDRLLTSTGTASWASATYTETVDAGGWWIHDLPVDAHPWGIAASGGQVWMVDNGRQVLAKIEDSLSVAACKVADADGDLATTDDQSPVEGWRIYLTVDGTPQGEGQVTGASGCVTWSDLAPGVTYGIEEEMQASWVPLTATSHDFGVLAPGEAAIHTFVNTRAVEVSACKREDADGDLATTDDQTPVEDWTIYLLIDGERQEPGKETDAFGCVKWTDLAPGVAYGVEEEMQEGWIPLAPTSADFGVLLSGEATVQFFVNAETVEVSACKLEDADGDLATTDDQSPAEGWRIYLTVDGTPQGEGQVTGASGCVTWTDLAPGVAYGVEEEMQEGWSALTPASVDFGTAPSGASYAAEFINTKESYCVFLPLILRR